MRSIFAAGVLLAILIGMGTASAAGCPTGVLGVGRTIVVDPNEHVRLGSMQYTESLPLNDREVVLTFDDGPLPPYTDRILDTLASECVKATFFMVGRMVRAYPSLVQRIHADGHTVANHSENHPFTFNRMTVDQAAREIEDGFASLRSVLDDPRAVAPFFRIPGLLRQDSVERYLAAHGYMTWSVDFVADDWTRISSQEIARRALARLESRGRGILLLHDIQPATALALPEILRELKARGFKIVHVVPATTDRPKTITRSEQWVARRSPQQSEQRVWPRTLVAVNGAKPVLSAPNPANFGIENFGDRSIKLALAHKFERQVMRDDGTPVSSLITWPVRVAYSLPAETDALPVPGAQNFRYSRPFRIGPEKPKLAARKPVVSVSSKPLPLLGSIFFLPTNRPRPVGPHFPVARPPGQVTGPRPPNQSKPNQSNMAQPPRNAHSAEAR